MIKDAGDDPDVTHGALVLATVRRGAAGSGVQFKAGPGVGTVTLPGLPVPPGEPAINPVPRKMMRAAIAEVARALGHPGDVEIEIAIPHGEEMAAKTLNARLGIVGGLSILGTTGVVIPYSCAAWIASIHNGIDVARATGLTHVAGATGRTSEAAVKALYDLPETALLDMGDFVGGTLKYLRTHPVPRVTIAGGIAKITKLAQGMLDLHSARGRVELGALAEVAREGGGSQGPGAPYRRRQHHAGGLRRLPRAKAFTSAMKWRSARGKSRPGSSRARRHRSRHRDLRSRRKARRTVPAESSPGKPVHAAPPKR